LQRLHGRGGRALLATAATIAVGAVAPAAASAVTVTVTGDDGNPVALGGPVNIRNMGPTVASAPTGAQNYKIAVVGPNGAAVSGPPSLCTSGTRSLSVDYVGNGAYAVAVNTYAANDFNCAGAPTAPQQTLAFTITGSVTVAAPPGIALTRKPGSAVTNTVTLPVDPNPGALSNDAFVALNGQVGPDGALLGTPQELFVDSTARTVQVPLTKGPGSYVIVARAKGFTGQLNLQAFTPWSPPTIVRAVAPFDVRLSFPDSRGPSYRLKAIMNENSTNGRVSVAIARGSTSGKYRSYGSVKVRGHQITKRFTLGRTGTYRVRFKYKGNATVAPGFEVFKFHISRRFVGAAAASPAAASLHR
jgi:hypothetical protein